MSTELDHRLPVHMEVNPETGAITWEKVLVDHNKDVFHRGKTVTNDEFNDLFVRHTAQSNHVADSLDKFLKQKFRNAVSTTFRNEFNLKQSYVKIFGVEDWGTADSEGYYHIVIPASTHGFAPATGQTALEKMNINTEMYVLDGNEFYEVMQLNTDTDNTVTLYTDDATLTGFVVIRLNDTSYTLQEGTIAADQVTGLATVATTGDIDDLLGTEALKTRVSTLERSLNNILSDTVGDFTFVHSADYATNANTAEHLAGNNATINNIPISNIFEPSSSIVKKATNGVFKQSFGTLASLVEFCSQHVVLKAIFEFTETYFDIPTVWLQFTGATPTATADTDNTRLYTYPIGNNTNCLEGTPDGLSVDFLDPSLGALSVSFSMHIPDPVNGLNLQHLQLRCDRINQNPSVPAEEVALGGIVAEYTKQQAFKNSFGNFGFMRFTEGTLDLSEYFVQAHVYYTN